MDFDSPYASAAVAEPFACERLALAWRVIDLAERIVAFMLLVALLPFLLLAGLTVVVLSRRSPLVSHRRVGRHGRELWVLKLRTMWGPSVIHKRKGVFAEPVIDEGEPKLKQSGDPRVSSGFAVFCRRYSVDELPQLWHVVRGEMSLVGPRPLTAQELNKYYGQDTPRLLTVKPGLSGLWQIKGRSSLNREERRRLDLLMIDNWSLKLYVQVLQATLPTVISGRNAW